MADNKNKPLEFFVENLIEPDDTFPEPLGDNNLSAFEMFEERKYYSDIVYPPELFVPKPFDLWYERPYFGKVNYEGNACFASKEGLKQLENNVWVLDFVADAFKDFREQFLFLNRREVEGTPFEFLDPIRGWSSAFDLYDQYIDSVYDVFLTYVKQQNYDKRITNFASFMDVMYDFVNDSSPNIPITISKFIMSSKCPSTTSGFMIDITTDGHGNDESKFNNFLNNPNFECCANTAERFGFKIDKNFPGRFIADIESPVMNRQGDPSKAPWEGGQGYMLRYPKAPPEFVENPPPPPIRIEVKPPSPAPERFFEIGDNVQFVVMIAHGNSQNLVNYILSDHTDIVDRINAPSVRNEKLRELLVYYTTLQGRMSPYIFSGKITDFVDGYPLVSIDFSNIESFNGSDLSIINDTAIFGRDYYSAPYNQTTVGPLFKNGQTSGGVLTFTVGVPADSIHVRNSNDIAIRNRFLEKINYPIKLQKYEQQLQENERRYQEEVANYDAALVNYNERKRINQEQIDFANNATRMSTANLFDRRFITAYLYDISSLKEICLQFYYSYVTLKPEVTVTKLIDCAGTKVTKNKVIKREEITRQIFNEKYPDTYWIKQYILMLNAQSENKKDFDHLRRIKTRAIQIYNLNGLEKTLKYLSDEMIKK